MSHYIIALWAPGSGHGKTTVAHHLRAKHGFQQLSFAEPLRVMLYNLLQYAGVPHEKASSYLTKNKDLPINELPDGVSARDLMRRLADGFGRNHRLDFWAEILKSRELYLRNQLTEGGAESLFVIDDLRFPEELDALNEMGAKVWTVTRPKHFSLSEPGQLLRDALDPEVELINDKSVSELYLAIDVAMENFR